jgi:hypothetical protein
MALIPQSTDYTRGIPCAAPYVQQRLGRPRKTWVNETYFDTLDEMNLYWLGFIMADGSVSAVPGRSWQLVINLAKKDLQHLKNLHAKIGGTIVPCGDNAVGLIVCSKHMVLRLMSLGVVPRKSYAPMPLSDDLATTSFLRGLFDGDGCLSVTAGGKCGKLLAHFCGHPLLVEWFIRHMGAKKCWRRMRNGTLYASWPRADSTEIASKLYIQDGTPRLTRKAILAIMYGREVSQWR